MELEKHYFRRFLLFTAIGIVVIFGLWWWQQSTAQPDNQQPTTNNLQLSTTTPSTIHPTSNQVASEKLAIQTTSTVLGAVDEITPTTTAKVVLCDSGDFASDFLCLLNTYRTSRGAQAVALRSALNDAAEFHSSWMQSVDDLSHIGEGGSTFTERCQQFNTTCSAENIAFGADTPGVVLGLWQQSELHNENLLGEYEYIGISLVGEYATLMLD